MQIFTPNDKNIDDLRPKVIETPTGIALNTQMYTKEHLAPIPFQFLNIYGDPAILNTQQYMFLAPWSYNCPRSKFGFYKDTKYNNRYYVSTKSGLVNGDAYARIFTIEIKDNSIQVLNTYSANAVNFFNFIDQDDRFIYFTLKSNTSFYLYRLDKLTYAVSDCGNSSTGYNYSRFDILYIDDTYIYYSFYADRYIYFRRFNKVTLTSEQYSTTLFRNGDSTHTVRHYYSTLSDDIVKLSETEYGVYYYNPTVPEQPIGLYGIDITKATTDATAVFYKPVNITWNSEKTELTYLNTNSIYQTYWSFIAEIDGVRYLNMLVYQKNFDNIATVANQGIYTFRMNSETDFTFLSYNQIDNSKQIHSFLYDASRKHLIIAKQNAFEILKFDKNTSCYENTGLDITSCYTVGLDELQRLWYIKQDYSVHVVNLEDAQSVQIDFEKPYYEYTGTSISSYITFSALNYLSEEVVGTFELVLEGPAIFTENNSNKLVFDYNGSGKQQINITITGASSISVYPRYLY